MITAEDYIMHETTVISMIGTKEKFKSAMIEFAKMHVEQALKEALSKMYIETDLKGKIKGVNEYSILNAYPLTNIK